MFCYKLFTEFLNIVKKGFVLVWFMTVDYLHMGYIPAGGGGGWCYVGFFPKGT